MVPFLVFYSLFWHRRVDANSGTCVSCSADAIVQALKLTRQLAMRLTAPPTQPPAPQQQASNRPLQQQLEALLVSDPPAHNANSHHHNDGTENGNSGGGGSGSGHAGCGGGPNEALVADLVSTLLTVLTGPGAHPLTGECKGALAALLSALLDSSCQVGRWSGASHFGTISSRVCVAFFTTFCA